ncbi:hypothetical protein C0580_01340 [Candidatus Parcubacteria bacterium]|nr:MAG: hypothetical protein C0580_01340 [Candidatus Parcubacteria bacterium]
MTVAMLLYNTVELAKN